MMILTLAKIKITDIHTIRSLPNLILKGVEPERLSKIKVLMEVDHLYFPIIDIKCDAFLGRSLRPYNIVRVHTSDFVTIEELNGDGRPCVSLIDLVMAIDHHTDVVFSYCETIRDGSGRFITSTPVHYSGQLVIYEDVL